MSELIEEVLEIVVICFVSVYVWKFGKDERYYENILIVF